MKKVLDVKNLSISFGGIKAVNDLSFHVNENEIYGLIGPNGAGKTTVFNCITQFYTPDNGKIIFNNNRGNDVDLVGIKTHKVINEGVVRTFQNVELIADLSVIDNLLVGAHIKFKWGIFAHSLRFPPAVKEERILREKALKILEFFDIAHLQDQSVSSQPYGILKKIELGRALMCDPKLILLDEPAAGLNDSETVDLVKLLKQMRDDYNCTIIMIEHDMRLVLNACDRICAISFGEKLAEGISSQVQENPAVQEAYLGKKE